MKFSFGERRDKNARKSSDHPLSQVPSDLLDLVPGFLRRRESDIKEIRALLESGDFKGIKMIGHRLTGIGVGYGFPIISEIGESLERAALSRDRKVINESVLQLTNFMETVNS